jgi:hypothetical protein
VRECYEAYVIYNFYAYLTNFLEVDVEGFGAGGVGWGGVGWGGMGGEGFEMGGVGWTGVGTPHSPETVGQPRAPAFVLTSNQRAPPPRISP